MSFQSFLDLLIYISAAESKENVNASVIGNKFSLLFHSYWFKLRSVKVIYKLLPKRFSLLDITVLNFKGCDFIYKEIS